MRHVLACGCCASSRNAISNNADDSTVQNSPNASLKVDHLGKIKTEQSIQVPLLKRKHDPRMTQIQPKKKAVALNFSSSGLAELVPTKPAPLTPKNKVGSLSVP